MTEENSVNTKKALRPIENAQYRAIIEQGLTSSKFSLRFQGPATVAVVANETIVNLKDVSGVEYKFSFTQLSNGFVFHAETTAFIEQQEQKG